MAALPRAHIGFPLKIMKGLKVAGAATFYRMPLTSKSGVFYYCAPLFGDVMRFHCFLKPSMVTVILQVNYRCK